MGISRRPAHGGETATWASEKGASRSRNTPGRLVPFNVIRFSGGPTDVQLSFLGLPQRLQCISLISPQWVGFKGWGDMEGTPSLCGDPPSACLARLR